MRYLIVSVPDHCLSFYFDDLNLKFYMSRYDHPMHIQRRLSQELLKLFDLYLHWWENESTSF